MKNIDIKFITCTFDNKEHYAPKINNKAHNRYFDSEWMALIYAGLMESGVSWNDASYMSNYIESMVKGTIKESK